MRTVLVGALIAAAGPFLVFGYYWAEALLPFYVNRALAVTISWSLQMFLLVAYFGLAGCVLCRLGSRDIRKHLQ